MSANKMNNQDSNARNRHRDFWKRLLGKRPSNTVAEPDNSATVDKMTNEWLDKMEEQQHVKDITHEIICVNVIDDPMLRIDTNYKPEQLLDAMTSRLFICQEHWRIGIDIPEDACSKLTDPESGQLYGIARLKDGRRAVQIMPKALWEVASSTIEDPAKK